MLEFGAELIPKVMRNWLVDRLVKCGTFELYLHLT